MYNYYQPQTPQYSNHNLMMGLKGRPVSSLDEAKAIAIDFDGSIFYFPDLANNRIYTKQVNFDGTATINMYELKQLPPQVSTDYITREEFNTALENLLKPKKEPVKEKPNITQF